jgi:type II secretory ATPase GspE/PulE/Tfp pilus assembly ATPase PilB-like protein
LITVADVLRVEADLSDMMPVILSEVEIEIGLAHLISSKQAFDLRMMPFSRNEIGSLYVAVSDPDDITSRDQISKLLSGEEIVFCLAEKEELNLYLEKTYDTASEELEDSLPDSNERLDYEVRDLAIEQPIVRLVDSLINKAREERASDIHIEPRKDQTIVRFRVDGMLKEFLQVKQGWTKQMVARIKTLAKMRTDVNFVPQDGRISLKGKNPLDLRVVTVPTVYGEQVTMRLLDPSSAMLPLEALGMNPVNQKRYMECITKPQGVALVTGPTGSGKSTTLYSSLQKIITPKQKLISIEDPVEYRLEGITQIDVSSANLAGSSKNAMTFAKALRAILRSDPDVVMVGEIRDQETAQISMDAALTGHFLFSTLHTNTALQAITRLGELDVSPHLVANAVEVVVAQRLVRRLCKYCKENYQADIDYLRAANAPQQALESVEQDGPRILYQPSEKGCSECKGEGFLGRVGVHEVVSISPDLREKILANATLPELERTIRAEGISSLYEDAFLKIWGGHTSIEEVLRVVS